MSLRSHSGTLRQKIIPEHQWGDLMSEQFTIYRCNECGCMLEIIKAGNGDPICCGAPMEVLPYNADEAAAKKHAITVTGTEDKHSVVRLGGFSGHPMKNELHFFNC